MDPVEIECPTLKPICQKIWECLALSKWLDDWGFNLGTLIYKVTEIPNIFKGTGHSR